MIEEMNNAGVVQEVDDHIKFDYTLETPEERNELVKKIIENTPPEKLTKMYLEKMADYILLACKKEIKEHNIMTESRWKNTVKKREVSLEGLSASFENKYNEGGVNSSAEDYVYNLIVENDKNVILTPKNKITEKDIEEVPGLKELYAEIHRLENEVFPAAKGKAKYSVKENIKALYKDAYVLRASFRGSINCVNTIKAITKIDLYENIVVNKDGELEIDCNLSLLIPKHVSLILCNYSKIKQEAHSKFTSDIYYTMLTLDDLVEEALKDYPLYKDILIYKIDGLQNVDIQKKIEEDHGIKYSVEYISSLWRNKIPKLIAETAEKRWLVWHYSEEEPGKWKRCSKCGQIKLAHNKFFLRIKVVKMVSIQFVKIVEIRKKECE